MKLQECYSPTPPPSGGQQEGVGELKNKCVRKMLRSFKGVSVFWEVIYVPPYLFVVNGVLYNIAGSLRLKFKSKAYTLF